MILKKPSIFTVFDDKGRSGSKDIFSSLDLKFYNLLQSAYILLLLIHAIAFLLSTSFTWSLLEFAYFITWIARSGRFLFFSNPHKFVSINNAISQYLNEASNTSRLFGLTYTSLIIIPRVIHCFSPLEIPFFFFICVNLEWIYYMAFQQLWSSILLVKRENSNLKKVPDPTLVSDIRTACSSYKLFVEDFVANISLNVENLSRYILTFSNFSSAKPGTSHVFQDSFISTHLLSNLEHPLLSLSYLTTMFCVVLENILLGRTEMTYITGEQSMIYFPQLLQEVLDSLVASANKRQVELFTQHMTKNLVTTLYSADKTCIRYLFFIVIQRILKTCLNNSELKISLSDFPSENQLGSKVTFKIVLPTLPAGQKLFSREDLKMFLIHRANATFKETITTDGSHLEIEISIPVFSTKTDAIFPTTYQGMTMEEGNNPSPEKCKEIKTILEDLAQIQITLFSPNGSFSLSLSNGVGGIVKHVYHIPLTNSGSCSISPQQVCNSLNSDIFFFYHANVDCLCQALKEHKRMASEKIGVDKRPVYVIITNPEFISRIRHAVQEYHFPVRRVVYISRPFSDYKLIGVLRLCLVLKESLFKVKQKGDDNSSSDDNWEAVGSDISNSSRLRQSLAPSTTSNSNAQGLAENLEKSKDTATQVVNRKPKGVNFSLGAVNKFTPPVNVLIVEDNPINQKILSQFLKKKGIRHSVASNGAEAIEKWSEGGFHLVLMDIQLPVMDGIEATRRIRQMEREIRKNRTPRSSGSAGGMSNPSGGFFNYAPGVKGKSPITTSSSSPRHQGWIKPPVVIVALTASSLSQDRHEALSAGCNDFLTKPVNLLWLEKKIIEWGSMQALIDFMDWSSPSNCSEDSHSLQNKTLSTLTEARQRKVRSPGEQTSHYKRPTSS